MAKSVVGVTSALALSAALAAGCSDAGGTGGVFNNTGGAGTAGTGGGIAGGAGTGGGISGNGGGPIIDAGGGGNSDSGTSSCQSGPNDDADKDGFTVAAGDCNDCDANANPGALDVNGNNVDEDCNGTADDTTETCDAQIPDVGYTDPKAAAQALGLCHFPSDATSWGVLDVKYVLADGTTGANSLGHGLLDNFGPNVNAQEGKNMLALSSGTARRPGDVGYQSPGGADLQTSSPQPPGFPIDTPACPGVTTGGPANDPTGLELKIRVPTNAKSFKFLFNFYTYEFPVYICSAYNDFFIALQDPPPSNAVSGNISFDSQNNPVSVNNGFLEVCDPAIGATNPGGKFFPCSLGAGALTGTGFEGHAATGWLETQSPVIPGSEVTLRFVTYDVGDHVLDSTTLLDAFRFSAEEATGTTTKPVPVPK